VKESAKYVATIILFVAISFVLSWFAVYSYWYSARIFHSVAAVRVCDTLGSFILLPARAVFWLLGDIFDQSAPLSDPITYVAVNAGLLGSLAYSVCRRWLFASAPERRH